MFNPLCLTRTILFILLKNLIYICFKAAIVTLPLWVGIVHFSLLTSFVVINFPIFAIFVNYMYYFLWFYPVHRSPWSCFLLFPLLFAIHCSEYVVCQALPSLFRYLFCLPSLQLSTLGLQVSGLDGYKRKDHGAFFSALQFCFLRSLFISDLCSSAGLNTNSEHICKEWGLQMQRVT